MTERRFLVRAGLKRNYGKHEIYFELSEEISAASTGQVREAFLSLQSLLDEQVKVYEQTSLPHVALPDSRNTGASSAAGLETFALETIKVESQDGKKRIKACGGKYVKHGVPVYEECQTDLPIETLDYGVFDYRELKLTVSVQMDNGKPKKAVSIR